MLGGARFLRSAYEQKQRSVRLYVLIVTPKELSEKEIDMNELDLAFAVFVSSGAGYLLGKHFERKKARAAFANFARQVLSSTMVVQDAIMTVVRSKMPDIDPKALSMEMAAECAKRGINVRVADMVTGQVVNPNDNQTK